MHAPYLVGMFEVDNLGLYVILLFNCQSWTRKGRLQPMRLILNVQPGILSTKPQKPETKLDMTGCGDQVRRCGGQDIALFPLTCPSSARFSRCQCRSVHFECVARFGHRQVGWWAYGALSELAFRSSLSTASSARMRDHLTDFKRSTCRIATRSPIVFTVNVTWIT